MVCQKFGKYFGASRPGVHPPFSKGGSGGISSLPGKQIPLCPPFPKGDFGVTIEFLTEDVESAEAVLVK